MKPAIPSPVIHRPAGRLRVGDRRVLDQLPQPLRVALAALLVLAATALPAAAIQPAFWTHSTEADFSAGETDNTVVTNLGDVKLATGTEASAQLADQATVIHDLHITPDGQTFMAIGPEGALLRKRGDEIEKVLSLPKEQIFTMTSLADGRLLVAVSATDSRLAVLNGDKLDTLLELEGVRYVWDMAIRGDRMFLATGTDGKLLTVRLDQLIAGKQPPITVLLDTAQNNLLCMDLDSQGRIYAGSDGEGLVYRVTVIDDGEPEVFVLYDAPEPEIGALLVLDNGTVYAGTADADQARPGRLEEAQAAESGRPDRGAPAGTGSSPDDMPRVPPQPEPMLPPENEPQSDRGPALLQGLSDPVTARSTHQAADEPAGATEQASSPATLAAEDQPADRPANGQPQIPTAQQRDALRAEIRHRLQAARTSGSLKAGKSPFTNTRRFTRKKAANKPGGGGGNGEGNAIYRISPDGFVAEVFRESVMILKLLEDPSLNGTLIVATGNEGQLFRVDPAADETTILADLDPQQVPAMVKDPQGRVLLGTANPATLIRLESGFAKRGVYTSDVLDAGQISLWGKLHVSCATPKDTSVALQTRSGNVQNPEQANWSDWSTPQLLTFDPSRSPLTPRETTVGCPPARFLQYRLTLTGQGRATPVVYRTHIAYVVPNLKPVITSIQATYPNADAAASGGSTSTAVQENDNDASLSSVLELEWEASDANSDRLMYRLEYQPTGSTRWLALAKDLEESSFKWQTRLVPDGHYLVRVVASDHPDNPPGMAKFAVRRAAPVLVDNTPPTIGPLDHRSDRGNLRITGWVEDAMSPIRQVSYNVDSADFWSPVLPDDLIYDSTREAFTITIPSQAEGGRVVAIRATDRQGNRVHEALLLEPQ